MSDYDIYHQWLGIPKSEQPPHHYRLLGLALFEGSPDVIRNAAERQMRQVRHLCRGEYEAPGQALLNELAAAKICLLNEDKKRAYDAQLQSKQSSAQSEQVQQRDESKTVAPTPAADRVQRQVTPASVPASPRESGVTAPHAVSKQAKPAGPRPIISDGPVRAFDEKRTKWVVGAAGTCDVVVDRDSVSGIHCSVQNTAKGLLLADELSTNGTFVNRNRVSQPLIISPRDLITLGQNARLKIPLALFPDRQQMTVVFLGRLVDNEMQLDHPSVSSFHARIIVEGDDMILEDIGSSNGTFVLSESAPKRIARHRVQANDTFAFGACHVTASEIAGAVRRPY